MKIGFVGPKTGMSANQLIAYGHIIESFHDRYGYDSIPAELHHNDTLGAAEQADKLAFGYYKIVVHPSSDPERRAFSNSFGREILPEKPLMERNQDMVDAVNILIAAPKKHHEEEGSETWETVRMARTKGIPVIVLEP